MAKVPKLASKAPSLRSRASRRATSSTVNAHKFDETAKASPEGLEPIPAALKASKGSNISKKTKTKPLTRKQRMRKEKGIERAYVVTERTEAKVGKSKTRGKMIKDRSADWEDLNTTHAARKRKKENKLKSTLVAKDSTMEDVVDAKMTEPAPAQPSDARPGSDTPKPAEDMPKPAEQDDLDLIT